MGQAEPTGIRRAEIMAALSLATDLAMGQPLEFALKSCVVGIRLATVLGFGTEEMREVYYHSLLRYIGCNAETYSLAALFGDEIELRRDFALIDSARAPEVFGMVLRHLRHANAGAPPIEMMWGILRGLATSKRTSEENIAGHCEVAQRLAERLGFGAGIIRNLGQIYERWDGRGLPQGLKGEAIAPAVRVVTLAQDAIVLSAAHGEETMIALVKKRSGQTYDPAIADRFVKHAAELLAGLDAGVSWDAVLKLEPAPQAELTEAELDAACLAIADFTDIKSPYVIGHSRAVATLAEEAASIAGLPARDAVDLRRAALLHDLGQVAISARIWTKPAALTDAEWEQVRLHPYYTERVLARPKALARLGAIAAQHHERCDGSGYHKSARVQALSLAGKILAAAEMYQAMIEPRPHRAAQSPQVAANALKAEARAGKLDADAVAAVLTAAGHVMPKRSGLVAGLSAREIEVLRLVARGQSMKEVARTLGLSPKTVDNHIQNIYGKIGVSTRGGATLFAIEHGLAGSGDS
jgi:HD-GYP domain-containing protein (c-di-GMP phosphodiesterase class II)